MRLVEHHHVVVREHVAATCQVRAVEMRVDDDDGRLLGSPPRRLGETGFPGGAAERARALGRGHTEAAPHPRSWLEVELGPVAGSGRSGPLEDPDNFLAVGAELIAVDLVEIELVIGAALGLTRSLPAEVVGSALQHGELDGKAEVVGEEGKILGRQLVLERLGRGRHHDLFAQQQGGHEVRQRLARTRAGLHDEMAAFEHRRGDRLRHLHLTGPCFAAPGQRRRHPRQGVGHAVAHQAHCPRATSRSLSTPGRSVMIPSTPRSRSRVISAGSSIVQTWTTRPRLWAAARNR